jgi:hypothetical protein
MIEFEERMAAISGDLSSEAKALTREVLKLELQHRFGDRSQLPEEFAARALKAVKARPEGAV